MRKNKFFTGSGYGNSAEQALDSLLNQLDRSIHQLMINDNDVVIVGVSHDVMATNTPDVHDFKKFHATAVVHYTVEKG